MVNTSIVFLVLQMIVTLAATNSADASSNESSPDGSGSIFMKKFISGSENLVKSINASNRLERSAKAEYAFPYYDNYNRRNQYPPSRPEQSGHKESHGIHVANWRWDEIGVFFTFTAFVVITGLAKVGEFILPPPPPLFGTYSQIGK